MLTGLALAMSINFMAWWSAPAGTVTDLEPIGTYTISAYSYSEGGGENYQTAGGYTPEPYFTVATSDEYPIGTYLYIDGIGTVQVQDRGNFPANRVDLHIGYDDCNSFGLQNREVYRFVEREVTNTEKIVEGLKNGNDS